MKIKAERLWTELEVKLNLNPSQPRTDTDKTIKTMKAKQMMIAKQNQRCISKNASLNN